MNESFCNKNVIINFSKSINNIFYQRNEKYSSLEMYILGLTENVERGKRRNKKSQNENIESKIFKRETLS